MPFTKFLVFWHSPNGIPLSNIIDFDVKCGDIFLFRHLKE